MIIKGLKDVILQKSENHPNRPLVAISVPRADWLLRLGTELVGAGLICAMYGEQCYSFLALSVCLTVLLLC